MDRSPAPAPEADRALVQIGREQAAEYGVGLGKDRGQAIASTL